MRFLAWTSTLEEPLLTAPDPHTCHELLRLSPEDYVRLLREARRPERSDPGGEHERAPRSAFGAQRTIIVALRPPGGGALSVHRVTPVNMSLTGLAFIHGAFVEDGTECSAIINDVEGLPCQIRGEVTRSRVLSGRAHEIGIKFESTIDVGRFIAGADTGLDPSHAPRSRTSEDRENRAA